MNSQHDERDKYSYDLIGLAMEVHRELGPGLDECFYHQLLSAKLDAKGIPYQFKPYGKLIHRGMVADTFEADLIVGDELIPELKVLRGGFNAQHLLQNICYLKYWNVPAGLLFDFGRERLIFRRVAFTCPVAGWDAGHFVRRIPESTASHAHLYPVVECLAGVLKAFGLGYRDTTYRGLLHAELNWAGISCVVNPLVTVRSTGKVLGETRLECLAVPDQCALYVAALHDMHLAADRAVLQTFLRHLNLPWGLAINFGKRKLDCQFVTKPKR